MIVKVEEQFDLSLGWFEKQSKRDALEAWQERLCELLSIYKLHDADEAIKVGEMMKKIGFEEKKVNNALE